jgi:UDP-N-acetylglucosamine 3-dehydrogenase
MNVRKPLNLAFLGCGHATRLHSRTLMKLDPSVRRFYASRDATRAEAYSRKYGGAGHFDSYAVAYEDPSIDAVLVATPPSTHLDLTLNALRTDTHVIVEKPPYLRAIDFDDVEEALADTTRHVLVAENYFYKPLTTVLRNAIRNGTIGDVLFVHLNALKEQRVDDWRADARTSGGGALFEGGIHWISLLASLGMEVQSISGARAGPREGLERSVALTIRYEGGAVGTLLYSWQIPSLFKGLRLSRVFGREGSITFESNGVFVLMGGRRKRLIFPGLRDIAGYRAMFRDFLAALRGEAEPRYTLELARRDLSLVEAAYRSMRGAARGGGMDL